MPQDAAFLYSLGEKCGLAVADGYLKSPYTDTNLPPDANKLGTGADLSCWLATAANMLAGAGYGFQDGEDNSVQGRADRIYGQLKIKFTTSG